MKVKPIRSHEDLREAKAALAHLVSLNGAGDKSDDIEVQAAVVEQFERSNIQVFAPTPIAAIKFRMEELGLSPRHLEPFIGSRARVSEVLSGNRSLSINMIRSLHEGLGIPYASLMSERTNSSGSDIPKLTIERLNSFGFDLEQGDLPGFVQSSLPDNASLALHRKTRTQRAASKTDQRALLLWQAAVLKRADVSLPEFEQSRLTPQVLRRIAILSSSPTGPQDALKALQALGISVVTLPPLPGTFLDGAALVNASRRPIIALTLRHDRTDSFWFTFLHEAAHIHLHYDDLLDGKGVFVDDMDIQSEDAQEREADDLARTSLIPDSIISQVRWDAHSTIDDIHSVASKSRIHVAIVAGRWQRDHQNYRKFSRLIERDKLRDVLLD